MKSTLQNPRNGYSLMELLAVITVIALLAGLSVPALRGLTTSGELSTAAQQVSDFLTLARSTAITQNTLTRFVVATDWPSATAADYRSMSVWKLDSDGTTWNPITKWEPIPPSVSFDPSSSSYPTMTVANTYLFATSTANTFAMQVQGQNVTGRYAEFVPTGAARVPGVTASQVWIALTSSASTASIKANSPLWATIAADPFTGRIKITRP